MKVKNHAPYIINAHIQWLEDSGLDPHITLRNSDKTKFPPHLNDRSSVKFNITSGAVNKLVLDEYGITFSARFNGAEHQIIAPFDCIMGLHSRNGEVNIPITVSGNIDQQSIETPKEPVKLTVIQGGASGDGIPSGKLTLV